MDVKDLRTESGLSERNNDGSKYTQDGVALQCNRNKSYQDIGSIPMAKAEPTPVRPCAVIGPDRVVPPPASNDVFLKKSPVEPWLSPDNLYRRPPEYPHKISSSQNPSRNISPRQTFQENMQRISVPPTYNAVRHSDEANFNHIHDRNVTISKNVKPNVVLETKYCDVPYAINPLTSEPKNFRDTEMYVSSVNSPLTRTATNSWPASSVNVQAPRVYGAHELYQYPQYPSCAGQRPTLIPMTRPHRTIPEDPAYAYPDHYYQDASARFKPYLPVKERYPQPRYEYIANYPSHNFHPPAPLQPHKYDTNKSGQSHPYSVYPHLKYLDSRVPDHSMEAYQRSANQPPNYNIQFRNQVIHPTYATTSGNSSQNKLHPYPLDGSVKMNASNKLHNDTSSKMYIDYENARTKTYPISDNYFANEIGRVHPHKNQMVMPNYSSIGVHAIPTQQYYRKDNPHMKPFEYMPHFRTFEHPLNSNAMMRHAPQFSPNTLAISPTESNTSNDTSQTHGTSQEDCGYVSQSSAASVRSIDSGIYRMPNEYYKRYDFRYGPIVGSSPTLPRSDSRSSSVHSKESKQKQIDVRQFLQMWNEGEEENSENSIAKEIVIQTGSSDTSNYPKHHTRNQDQLYVLGLVNVPSEELSKYEHIQKISKLPENIKGYNNLELLSQFEEAIESSNTSSFKSNLKEFQMTLKENTPKQTIESLPRPVSPLDVEAKISQSVIHKEVRCNFEIKPCSPKMLNVEVAAPVQNLLGERLIEKVTNPLSNTIKSPMSINPEENLTCHTVKRQENTFAVKDNPSCKMVSSPYATNNSDSVKTNYTLQDLEINSGVCLASLPRLDNEIEFNFPEVNQQFINANKKDCNTMQDQRIILEKEQGSLDKKCDRKDIDKNEKALVTDEPGKTFMKLSKYRKMKTNPCDSFEKNLLTKVVRTDSVIIKNPENIRNIEDKLLENCYNVPINLSSQSLECHTTYNLGLPDKLYEKKDNNVDIALDFSLNKSGLLIIDNKNCDSKPLSTENVDVACENVSLTDPNESFNKSTILNEHIILKSKDTITNCIEPERHPSCIENDQSSVKDYLVEDITNAIAVNTNHKVLNEVCVVSGETLTANEHLKDNYDADHIKTNSNNEMSNIINDNDTVSSIDQPIPLNKYDTPMSAIKSKDNICDKDSLAEDFVNATDIITASELVSDYEEGREMMELLSSENSVCNLINDNEDSLRRFKINNTSSQNKNDFENDEISAKLEKLFQESTEDITLDTEVKVLSKSHNLNWPVTKSVEFVSFHQSKELYSPRIQKLLTYTEGLCTSSGNQRIPKESLNLTLENGIYVKKTKSVNSGIKKDEQLHNQNYDPNNRSTCSSDHTMVNKIYIKETIEMSGTKFETKPENSTNICVSDNVELLKKYQEDKSLNLIIQEETKISIVTNTSIGLENLPIKLNGKFEQNKWELNISDTVESSNVANSKEKSISLFDSIIAKGGSHETSDTKKSSNDCIIESEYNCAFSNTEDQKYKNPRENSIMKKVFKIEDIHAVSETADSNNIKLELSTVVQSSNKSCKSVSKCITEAHIVDQTVENRETFVENAATHPDIGVVTKKYDTSKFVVEFDNTRQENIKSTNLDVNVSNASDYECKREENQDLYCLKDDIFESSSSNTDIASTQESLSSASILKPYKASDISAAHQIVENQDREGLVEKKIASHDNNICSGDIKSSLNNIPAEGLSCPIISNSVSDGRIGQHTEEKQVKESSTDKMIKVVDNDGSEANMSVCNIIARESDNLVLDDKDNIKIETDNIDYYTTQHRVQNQSEIFSIETCDSNSTGKKFDCNNIGSKCDKVKEKDNDPCVECFRVRSEPLEGEDCSNIDRDLKNQVQSFFNSQSIDDSAKCVSDYHSVHQTEKYQIDYNLIDNSDGNRSNGCDDVVDNFNGIVQNDLKLPGIESTSINNSDVYLAYQTERNYNKESVVVNNDSDTNQVVDCSKVESLIVDRKCDDVDNIVNSDSDRPEILNCGEINHACEDIDNGKEHSNNSGRIFPTDTLDNFKDKHVFTAHEREQNESGRNLVEEESHTLRSEKKLRKYDCDESFSNSFIKTLSCNIFDNHIANQTVKSDDATISIERDKKIRDNAISETTESANADRVVDGNIQNDLNNSNVNSIKISTPSNVASDYCKTRRTEETQSCVIETNKNKKSSNEIGDTINSANTELDSLNQVNFKIIRDKRLRHNDEKDNPDITLESTSNFNSEKVSISSIDDKIVHSPNICVSNVENNPCEIVEDNDEMLSKNRETCINNKEISIEDSPTRRRCSLKRSYSDSALHSYKYKDAAAPLVVENMHLTWPAKRQRVCHVDNLEQDVIDENLCNIIQNNRRKSVSSFYNDGNVSFCILIDNDCIVTEENEEEKICFAEIPEGCITEINTMNEGDTEEIGEIICCSQHNAIDFSDSVIIDYENEKSMSESWLDDVACVETVVSDNIEEDFTNVHEPVIDVEVSEYIDSRIGDYKHTDGVKFTNDENNINVSQVEDTYKTPPHINFDRTSDNVLDNTGICKGLYDPDYMDKILSESNSRESSCTSNHDAILDLTDDTSPKIPEDKENISIEIITLHNYNNKSNVQNNENNVNGDINQTGLSPCNMTREDATPLCEHGIVSEFNKKECDDVINYTTSSSPEVSSTTSEEKNSSILLKITNFNGSRISEINEINHNRPRCKFTEEKEYSNSHGDFPKRPLLTKAAQKYIPPIKESIRDLKVKLTLPQQRLLKLKQLKLSRSEPKINKQSNDSLTISKKLKPNFEDVLKSIDEVQIKMHKEKSKKPKTIIPKVVIKKNGSHYTSSCNKDTFNPDMTGRKWQPWVFLEKNHFIDKMAIKNKTKAIYNHRKNAYVLSENFKKYKSVNNSTANFVISQAKAGDLSKGKLKYTIRLKHTY